MKNTLITLTLLLSIFTYSQPKGYLDFGEEGGIANKNNPEVAAHNTEVMYSIMEKVKRKKATGVYNSGQIFYINELHQSDGFDFRYFNWRGTDKRRSVFALADNRNVPLIKTKLYFDASMRDIQFNGNGDNNPDAESVVSFKSALCYTVDLMNVYVRDYANTGFKFDNVTHFTLNNVDAKYGGKVGMHLIDCLGVDINSPDIEINDENGIIIESTKASTNRYDSPAIYIKKPHFERTGGSGILLKGVQGVNVFGGFGDVKGTFIKITNSGDMYSHYNNVYGRFSGKAVIEKGNYGNELNIHSGRNNKVFDLDGRNSGDFLKWKPWIDEISAEPPSNKFSTEPFDNKIYVAPNDKLKDRTITLSPTGSSSFLQVNQYDYEANKKLYTYFKVKGVNARVTLTYYDAVHKEWYNFSEQEFQSGANTNSRLTIDNINGTELIKNSIFIDDKDRKVYFKANFNASNDGVKSSIEPKYIMISNSSENKL